MLNYAIIDLGIPFSNDSSMLWSAFFDLIAILYYLSFLLLGGLSLFIAFPHGQQQEPNKRNLDLRRSFLLLSTSLLTWQASLFLEVRVNLATGQLWLGRVNFAAIVLASYCSLRFVQKIVVKGSEPAETPSRLALIETFCLTLLTLVTPLIDAEERIEGGRAIATFGPLFPLYLLHILVFLTLALRTTMQKRRQAKKLNAYRQLKLIEVGMFSTALIAVISNAAIPYGFNDFRFCDIGALSTLIFALAIAYATFLHGLFNLRVAFRETLVYGVLLTVMLGAYGGGVSLATQYLTESSGKAVQFIVLIIAFSFDPLRRLLEQKTDELLFGKNSRSRKTRGKRKK